MAWFNKNKNKNNFDFILPRDIHAQFQQSLKNSAGKNTSYGQIKTMQTFGGKRGINYATAVSMGKDKRGKDTAYLHYIHPTDSSKNKSIKVGTNVYENAEKLSAIHEHAKQQHIGEDNKIMGNYQMRHIATANEMENPNTYDNNSNVKGTNIGQVEQNSGTLWSAKIQSQKIGNSYDKETGEGKLAAGLVVHGTVGAHDIIQDVETQKQNVKNGFVWNDVAKAPNPAGTGVGAIPQPPKVANTGVEPIHATPESAFGKFSTTNPRPEQLDDEYKSSANSWWSSSFKGDIGGKRQQQYDTHVNAMLEHQGGAAFHDFTGNGFNSHDEAFSSGKFKSKEDFEKKNMAFAQNKKTAMEKGVNKAFDEGTQGGAMRIHGGNPETGGANIIRNVKSIGGATIAGMLTGAFN